MSQKRGRSDKSPTGWQAQGNLEQLGWACSAEEIITAQDLRRVREAIDCKYIWGDTPTIPQGTYTERSTLEQLGASGDVRVLYFSGEGSKLDSD